MDDRLVHLRMLEGIINDLRDVHERWVSGKTDPYRCRMEWQDLLSAMETLSREVPDIPRG